MSSSTSPTFVSLTPRPPTPPKDKILSGIESPVFDALRFLEEGHKTPRKEDKENRPSNAVATPSSHSTTNSNQQGSGTGKRVDFSPYLRYYDHSQPRTMLHSSPRTCLTRQTPLPLSRQVKPLRSILKPAIEPPPLTPDEIENALGYFSPEKPESYEKMLQSILHQLASPNRSARLDAYLAFNGSLKAYHGMPNLQMVADKMSLIFQFLSRDMAWKDPAGEGTLDLNIVTQSLTLTCALLFHPNTARAFDDDHRAFLIDRSISILDQRDAPVAKAIVKLHLYMLSNRRIYQGTVNAARVETLVNSLKSLEDRCSGNSAIAARLIVYQRLIEQAPAMMSSRIHDWIENVVHGLLSSNKEIRNRAIDVCTQAGDDLGERQQTSIVLHDILKIEVEENQSFGDVFNSRLREMISDPDIGPDVPRIWAALTLFFRYKRRPIYDWPMYRDWLLIIQKCLNSGNLAIKHQANLAWNKLVFAVMPDNTTKNSCRIALRIPIAGSLSKAGQDKHSQQTRLIALDSYYNLLHYGLRPGLNPQELDTAWDAYVHPVMEIISRSSSRGSHHVCRILAGLFKETGGTWNPRAAMETEAIKPEELHKLDARWVRSRIRRIINLFEPMLISALRSSSDMTHLINSWTLLWQTVAEAGSQEVIASKELKDAIAQVTNLFRRIWRSGLSLSTNGNTARWFEKLHDLLRITVESLGSAPFVEDILSKTTDDEDEAAPTPSYRPSKGHQSAHSPLVSLFSLYYHPPSGIKADESYRQSASWIIEFFSTAKVSPIDRLKILTQVMQECHQMYANSASKDIAWQLWEVISRCADDVLATLTNESNDPIQDIPFALRHMQSILVRGLQLSTLNEGQSEVLQNLCIGMLDAGESCDPDETLKPAVMEAISKALMADMDAVPLHTTVKLIDYLLYEASWPVNRRIPDTLRKAFSVAHPDASSPSSTNPFEYLRGATIEVSERLYKSDLPNDSPAIVQNYVCSMIGFLCLQPITLLPKELARFQRSIAIWIEDPQRRILHSVSGLLTASTDQLEPRSMAKYWSNLLDVIQMMPNKDSSLLRSMNMLIGAGLSSSSKDVANRTVDFWNATFGTQSTLEYPPNIVPVLRAWLARTNISLPGFPPVTLDESAVLLPHLVESRFDEPTSLSASIPTHSKNKIFRESRESLESSGISRLSHVAPETKQTDSGSANKHDLRHDNSQTQFAPTASSSLPVVTVNSTLPTDHQIDIRERQQENAQMFPDLTSSPNEQSASLTRNIPARSFLSSTSIDVGEDTIVTPTGSAEEHPMSDDLPSSPTPRASAKPAVVDDSDDSDMDPPSSPPSRLTDRRIPRRGPLFNSSGAQVAEKDETDTIALLDTPTKKLDAQLSDVDLPKTPAISNGESAKRHADNTSGPRQDVIVDTEHVVKDANNSNVAVEDSTIEVGTNDSSQSTDPSVDVTEIADDATAQDEDTSQRAQFSTRKRKRMSDTIQAGKTKSKKTRPSEVTPQPIREPDPESAEDEIVVVRRTNAATRATSAVEDSQASEPTTTRLRGRKRKSDMSQISESSPAPALRSKRSASVLGGANANSTPDADIMRPSPKVLRQRKSQDVKAADEDSQLRRSTRRQVSAVKIPDVDVPGDGVEEVEDDDDTVARASTSQESQVTEEQSTPARGRRIAQPRSIIARLRSIVSDCKKLIFGSQEERELDDVLFELRQEVHEAGRRGRAL